MKHSFCPKGWLLALAGVALLGVASCSDDGGGAGGTAGGGGMGGDGGAGGAPQLASELFGTWDLVSIEAAGMSMNCPGVIELNATEEVSCPTGATTFNSDGTFVEIETTDEFENPSSFWSEGTWSTQGSTLTLTFTQEGPDENNLQPVDPPETESAMWSVAGTTLTISVTSPIAPFVEIKGTLEKR